MSEHFPSVDLKMWFHTLFIFIFLYFTPTCHSATKKPASAYFNICNETDSTRMSECLKKSIMNVKPLLKKGVPELKIPKMEPMIVERLVLSEGQGNFHFNQTLTNLKIFGATDYEIKDISYNKDTLEMNIDLLAKNISFVGNYEMNGQVLVLPIKGKGEVVYNFINFTLWFKSKFEKYRKNDKDYLKVKKMEIKSSPEFATSHFTNLFNGDKVLGETTNKFLNDNWKAAYEAFHHLPEEAFAEIIKTITNDIFENFPFHELFPSVK